MLLDDSGLELVHEFSESAVRVCRMRLQFDRGVRQVVADNV